MSYANSRSSEYIADGVFIPQATDRQVIPLCRMHCTRCITACRIRIGQGGELTSGGGRYVVWLPAVHIPSHRPSHLLLLLLLSKSAIQCSITPTLFLLSSSSPRSKFNAFKSSSTRSALRRRMANNNRLLCSAVQCR